jgi:hypothetical protein
MTSQTSNVGPFPWLNPKNVKVRLGAVEHAFRSLKTVDLELRPVFHWTAPRVRAHVLLCMLAYYLQWHMRRSLAPMLFDEPDPAARQAQRTSVVAKAEPSPAAQRKAARKRTEPADGEPLPVHSFHTLLAISRPSPAMSSASGVIASPPSSPPPPAHSTAPSICSASPPPRRHTDPRTANDINRLCSKKGKVRASLTLLTWVVFGGIVVAHMIDRVTWPAVLYAVLSLTFRLSSGASGFSVLDRNANEYGGQAFHRMVWPARAGDDHLRGSGPRREAAR